MEEGSDEPDISYTCDGVGNYTFPRDNVTDEVILPKCLGRRKFSKLRTTFQNYVPSKNIKIFQNI